MHQYCCCLDADTVSNGASLQAVTVSSCCSGTCSKRTSTIGSDEVFWASRVLLNLSGRCEDAVPIMMRIASPLAKATACEIKISATELLGTRDTSRRPSNFGLFVCRALAWTCS
eukprot:TRINITY_DN31083_c0_g1_i1.p2 TRINITY_DN31083_c0_g1~~TRINITY_DN31083_c0_g1_i1.p2  ORF type:complete len:114 (-),score=5.63 TRINITY_DN31083_c0_g1_i1:253-594(-)